MPQLAPAPADVFPEFDLEGHSSGLQLIDPSTSLYSPEPLDKASLAKDFLLELDLDSDKVNGDVVSDVEGEESWDPLDDLTADPLGDNSLDAFINLDKYLSGVGIINI